MGRNGRIVPLGGARHAFKATESGLGILQARRRLPETLCELTGPIRMVGLDPTCGPWIRLQVRQWDTDMDGRAVTGSSRSSTVRRQ